jgi:hypothetical protein
MEDPREGLLARTARGAFLMTVNWDALVGLALFLVGTWFAGGSRWVGFVAMIFGVIYLVRAATTPQEPRASR